MMAMEELMYKLALSKVEGIGPIKYKKILEQVGTAKELFHCKFKQLKYIQGISDTNRLSIANFCEFELIEKEVLFNRKNDIQILDVSNEKYPSRLKQCIDAPAILFYKGTADLNHTRIISIIGTRSYSEYGKKICQELIEGLKNYNVLITSGLALGIDSIAHKSSLQMNIPTVGVLAHGLHSIYPTANAKLAKEMQCNGGLLSEYFSNAKIDKGNFPTRNRIVAGIADATLIIETDIKGGSMITGEIAYSYNRDLFCVPGRVTDSKSNGCNFLIKSLKGQMITNADDIAESLMWNKTGNSFTSQNKKQNALQRLLFVEFTEHEQTIIELLKVYQSLHIDEFYLKSVLNSSELASALLSLEMKNIIKIMPGKLITMVE